MKALSIIFYFITSIAIHAMDDDINRCLENCKNSPEKLMNLLESTSQCILKSMSQRKGLLPLDVNIARHIVSFLNLDINRESNSIQNSLGEALYLSVANGNAELVELLLDHNVNTEAKSCDTPLLTIATRHGYTDILKNLIAHGAHVNAQDAHGSTSLMLAARFNKLEAVKLLLNAGADITIKDNAGNTALIYAQEEPYKDRNFYKILYNKGEIIRLCKVQQEKRS